MAAVIAYIPDRNNQLITRWLRCPSCARASVVNEYDKVTPAAKVGRDVEGLPETVAQCYLEARRCTEVHAYTACEMMCRKILMHIAVDKGAKDGLTFAAYIDHLEKNHHVTPAMKPWVDVIRQHGNIAVHELPHTDRERAIGTLTFTEHLLRNVYEMEHLAKRFAPPE